MDIAGLTVEVDGVLVVVVVFCWGVSFLSFRYFTAIIIPIHCRFNN